MVYKYLDIFLSNVFEKPITADNNSNDENIINTLISDETVCFQSKIYYSHMEFFLRPYNFTDILCVYFLYHVNDELHYSLSKDLRPSRKLLYFLYSHFDKTPYLNLKINKGKIYWNKNQIEVEPWEIDNNSLFSYPEQVNPKINDHIKTFLSDTIISSKYNITTKEQRRDSLKRGLKQKQIFIIPERNYIPLLLHFMYYDGRSMNSEKEGLPYRKNESYTKESYLQLTKAISAVLSEKNIYEYLRSDSLFYTNKLKLFNSYLDFYSSDEFIDIIVASHSFTNTEIPNLKNMLIDALVKDKSFIKEIFQSSFPDSMYIFHIFLCQAETIFNSRSSNTYDDFEKKIESYKEHTIDFLHALDEIDYNKRFDTKLRKDMFSLSFEKVSSDRYCLQANSLLEKISTILNENKFVKYLYDNNNEGDANLFKYIDYETIKALITGEKL